MEDVSDQYIDDSDYEEELDTEGKIAPNVCLNFL
jgi:hypothetical protein